MRKVNLFKIGINLFGLFAIVMAFTFISSVLAAGAGISWATFTGAVVAGEPVTTGLAASGSPGLLKNSISQKVVQMKPAATPLDTIIRNIDKAVKATAWEHEYFAVDSRPLTDTVHAAYTKAGDGNTSTNLAVHNVGMWNPDDAVMVDGVDGVDNMPLVGYIISKNVGNGTILFQPLNGTTGSGTTAGEMIISATIPVDTLLTRLGPIKHELDAQTSPYAILPVKASNYNQIFMAQVEQSTFQAIHDKNVEWNFTDYEAQNIYDMRATMEYSFLFGVKAKTTNLSDNKERYSTGGITRYITKALEYGTGGTDRTIDNSTFVDWGKSIFTGNSGSDKRILFGANGLMANLSKVDTVQKQIEANKTEVVYGITFNTIETNFGTLLFKKHPLLDLCGWGDMGIVLDLNNIEKIVYKPMQTRTLDLKTSGVRNVDAVVIEETCGIITRYPDTHAVIGPKA
jgi:hypothetical protein